MTNDQLWATVYATILAGLLANSELRLPMAAIRARAEEETRNAIRLARSAV